MFTAQQIADFLNGTVEGDANVKVSDFSKIEEGRPNTLTFLSNPKYTNYIYETEASIVLVNSDFVSEHPVKAVLIRVEDAYASLATLLKIVEQYSPKKVGVEDMSYISNSAEMGEDFYLGAFAYVGESVKIGNSVKIYPQSYIGSGVTIGDNVTIYAGVKIYDKCVIGNNCIIHSGAVIGADGFGFVPEDGVYKKIPQIGNVILEDDVEVGANATIDRAVMGSTIIRQGVKLDNLIQIAHNVEIGKNTVMAAQVGVAGSTKVGENCVFGGQVGLGGHITIENNVKIGAQSGIISNTSEGVEIMGSPAIPVKGFFRSSAVFAKLPEIYRKLANLERELATFREKLRQ